ncbi:hypothetical protein TGGT1_281575 [Toxoplasma gondii GT1]|uniref:Uncharacterized protein n=1 Tax=Toxoplasma gondii (strain ATCC 50853 / GT1) TaxID=507601 RepID=S7UV96_TOXGG|nr:hypothetical protein TGGT1_281575 [Toxoplasma gondii GT1]
MLSRLCVLRPHRAAPLHAEVYIHLGGRVAECAALSPQLAGGGDVAGWVEGELSAFPSIFSGLLSSSALRMLSARSFAEKAEEGEEKRLESARENERVKRS